MKYGRCFTHIFRDICVIIGCLVNCGQPAKIAVPVNVVLLPASPGSCWHIPKPPWIGHHGIQNHICCNSDRPFVLFPHCSQWASSQVIEGIILQDWHHTTRHILFWKNVESRRCTKRICQITNTCKLCCCVFNRQSTCNELIKIIAIRCTQLDLEGRSIIVDLAVLQAVGTCSSDIVNGE